MADVREIEEAAANWLARRDSGAWSEADEAELQRWLASIDNRVEFIRLEAAWQQANRLKALGAGVAPGVVPEPGQWHSPPFVNGSVSPAVPPSGREIVQWRAAARRFVPWATAATLLLITSLLFWNGSILSRGSHSTPLGGLASIPMSDGSNITLNTDSEIRIAATEAERRIVLARGEAFFEVAADPRRPFVVIAGDQRVIAVGTKFSVRRMEEEAGEVSVAVIEGRVRVERAGTRAVGLPPADLAAGALARSGEEGVLVEEKSLREIEEHLSWRSGFLTFRETPLARAAAEFNRYSARKIVIDDPRVGDIRIGGHFRSTNVEVFIRLLENDFPIRVERRSEEIILTGSGP